MAYRVLQGQSSTNTSSRDRREYPLDPCPANLWGETTRRTSRSQTATRLHPASRTAKAAQNVRFPTWTPSTAADYVAGSRPDIVAWLNPPNFRPIQQTALAQRMLDTGTWFIQTPEFQRLMKVKPTTIWATGMRESLPLS